MTLREFAKQAWSQVSPAPAPAGENWHIEAICRHLEAQPAAQRLTVLLPARRAMAGWWPGSR